MRGPKCFEGRIRREAIPRLMQCFPPASIWNVTSVDHRPYLPMDVVHVEIFWYIKEADLVHES